jgi:hypothetical protein
VSWCGPYGDEYGTGYILASCSVRWLHLQLQGLQVVPLHCVCVNIHTLGGYIYDRRVDKEVLIEQSETTQSSMQLGLMSIRNLLA